MIHPDVKTSAAMQMVYAAYNLRAELEEGGEATDTPVKANAAVVMVGKYGEMAEARKRAGR